MVQEEQDIAQSECSLQSFLQFRPDNFGDVKPAVICNDGFHLSIQASKYHYCSPRNQAGPYETVELGCATLPETFNEYAEEPGATDTVYGNVPIFKVLTLVGSHGGIDWNQTIDRCFEEQLKEPLKSWVATSTSPSKENTATAG